MLLGNWKRLHPGIGIALLGLSLTGCSSAARLHPTRMVYEGPGFISFGGTSFTANYFKLTIGDSKSGVFRLLDRSSLKVSLELPMDDASSDWSPDGRYLARYQLTGTSTTAIYDTMSMKPVTRWQGFWVDKWAADGPQLLLGHHDRLDPSWWLADATNPEKLQPLTWAPRPQTYILWFSANKGRSIYVNGNRELVVGDLSTGAGRTLITGVHVAIVAPNGEAVAVSRGKAGVSIVDVQTGSSFDVPDSVMNAPFDQVGSWSPDSQRFAMLKDFPCRLLAIDRQKHVATWAPEKDCTVNYAAHPTATYWSHDSRYVFVGYEHRIATVHSYVGVFDFTTGRGKSYTIGDQVLNWLPDGTGVIAKIGRNPGHVEEYQLPPGK